MDARKSCSFQGINTRADLCLIQRGIGRYRKHYSTNSSGILDVETRPECGVRGG
jgi:hypothetical protein